MNTGHSQKCRRPVFGFRALGLRPRPNTLAMTTIVIGIRQMIGNGDTQTAWHLVMATALLALLPPIAVVALMQRWFVKGLIEPEK